MKYRMIRKVVFTNVMLGTEKLSVKYSTLSQGFQTTFSIENVNRKLTWEEQAKVEKMINEHMKSIRSSKPKFENPSKIYI